MTFDRIAAAWTPAARGLRALRCVLAPWLWAAALFGALLLTFPLLAHELNKPQPTVAIGTDQWGDRQAPVVRADFYTIARRSDLIGADVVPPLIHETNTLSSVPVRWQRIRSMRSRPAGRDWALGLEQRLHLTGPIWAPAALAAPLCLIGTALRLFRLRRDAPERSAPLGRGRAALRSGGRTLIWTLAALGAGTLLFHPRDSLPPYPGGPSVRVEGWYDSERRSNGLCVIVAHWTSRPEPSDVEPDPDLTPDVRWRVGYVPPFRGFGHRVRGFEPAPRLALGAARRIRRWGRGGSDAFLDRVTLCVPWWAVAIPAALAAGWRLAGPRPGGAGAGVFSDAEAGDRPA